MTTGSQVAGGMMLGLVVALPLPAEAAGFAVLEQNAKRMGTAYAGAGTDGDDIGSMWYNPANLTQFRAALQVGTHMIDTTLAFQTETDPVPATAPLFFNSDHTADGGGTAFVPNVAFGGQLNDHWYAGVTVNVPFGLTTEYDREWIGRYQALESSVSSLNINPALAYRLNDHWSVGAGVNVNYTELLLSNAVDLAATCAQLAGGACPNGALPGAGIFDGKVKIEGDDFAIGYNVGVLWSPDVSTRLSLSYRSELEHNFEGEADFSPPMTLGGFDALGPALGGGLAAAFRDTDSRADLTLPATASLSIRHYAAPRTALLLDVTWTGWAVVERLRVEFENPMTPAAETPLGWNNTWRYSLGVEHSLNDDWTLSGGLAYDESPVPNARLRTPGLPDNHRRVLGLGASQRVSSHVTVNYSYAHLFLDDTAIQWERPDGETIAGKYRSRGNNVSIAVNLRF